MTATGEGTPLAQMVTFAALKSVVGGLGTHRVSKMGVWRYPMLTKVSCVHVAQTIQKADRLPLGETSLADLRLE